VLNSQIQYPPDSLYGIVMHSCRSLFLIFIFIALTVACSKESAIETEAIDTSTPVTIAEPGIIRLGMFSHISSGLPSNYPSFAVIVDGHVQAVRVGSEVVDALDAIDQGKQIQDEDEVRLKMQVAMEKFLASQQMTPDFLTAENKKVILLFSPDESLGECPPCTEAFGSLQPNSLIGEFTIIRALLENR